MPREKTTETDPFLALLTELKSFFDLIDEEWSDVARMLRADRDTLPSIDEDEDTHEIANAWVYDVGDPPALMDIEARMLKSTDVSVRLWSAAGVLQEIGEICGLPPALTFTEFPNALRRFLADEGVYPGASR